MDREGPGEGGGHLSGRCCVEDCGDDRCVPCARGRLPANGPHSYISKVVRGRRLYRERPVVQQTQKRRRGILTK